MARSVLKYLLIAFTTLSGSVCLAQDLNELNFGNCGFAGSEIMSSDYSCQQVQQRSDSGIKKEALVQLAVMAWGLLTGVSDYDRATHLGPETASLNDGQRLEPRFSLSAQSDDVLLTVAYEF